MQMHTINVDLSLKSVYDDIRLKESVGIGQVVASLTPLQVDRLKDLQYDVSELGENDFVIRRKL